MDKEYVKKVHFFLADYFKDKEDPISPAGVKDEGLLESACLRPATCLIGGKEAYPSVFDKAAALFHSIISNHCFFNGNKRTALLTAMDFLAQNNFWIDLCSDEELFEFTRKVAAHEICDDRRKEVEVISKWFHDKTRKAMSGDRCLTYRDLKEILANFDVSIEEDVFYFVVQKKGGESIRILKRGCQGFSDYDPVYIADLRKRLELTKENGIDSARFYGEKGIDPDLNFLMKLRLDVFKKLAKT